MAGAAINRFRNALTANNGPLRVAFAGTIYRLKSRVKTTVDGAGTKTYSYYGGGALHTEGALPANDTVSYPWSLTENSVEPCFPGRAAERGVPRGNVLPGPSTEGRRLGQRANFTAAEAGACGRKCRSPRCSGQPGALDDRFAHQHFRIGDDVALPVHRVNLRLRGARFTE